MSAAAANKQPPLKWKLLHFQQLSQWTKVSRFPNDSIIFRILTRVLKSTLALLGDASHPSLPYLGQGAAMAVEDGATLGMLLSDYNAQGMVKDQHERNQQITRLLQFYENVRKSRAEIIVAGATHTRHYYHLPDGVEQNMRDDELAKLPENDWNGPCSFNWGDAAYQRDLLGFDVASQLSERMKSWTGSQPVASGQHRYANKIQSSLFAKHSTKI